MTATPDVVGTRVDTAALELALYRAVRALRNHDGGLGFTEWSVLDTVCQHGPITPGQIAIREGVQPPSVSRTLAALRAQQFVRLTGHPTDRRQVVVTATADGRTACAQRPATDALADLDPADRNAIARAATTIRTRLLDP